MKYFEFGCTKKQVPVLGLGCMRMDELSAKQVEKVIGTALENGISFFDHADIYGDGECEKLFGKAIRQSKIDRDSLFIQSKCCIRDGLYDFSRDYILKSVDGILSRLGTDRLDSLLLHRPDTLMDLDEVQEAFTKLYEEGKVLSFGGQHVDHLTFSFIAPLQTEQDINFSCVHNSIINIFFLFFLIYSLLFGELCLAGTAYAIDVQRKTIFSKAPKM